MERVKFRHWLCDVAVGKYPNGRMALVLTDAANGEDVAVATVNVPDVSLGPREVLIKNYSENEGMLDALEKAGWVKPTGDYVASGFALIPKAVFLGRTREQEAFDELLRGKSKPVRTVDKSRDRDDGRSR